MIWYAPKAQKKGQVLIAAEGAYSDRVFHPSVWWLCDLLIHGDVYRPWAQIGTPPPFGILREHFFKVAWVMVHRYLDVCRKISGGCGVCKLAPWWPHPPLIFRQTSKYRWTMTQATWKKWSRKIPRGGGGEVPVWAHGIWHMAYGIIWSLLENHLAYLLNGTQWYWTMTQATWKKWSRKIPKGGGVPIWAHGRYKFKLIQIQIKIYTSPWISRSPSGQGKLNDTW